MMATATAFWAGDAPGPSPMTVATMALPSLIRSWVAHSSGVSVGPVSWSGSSSR